MTLRTTRVPLTEAQTLRSVEPPREAGTGSRLGGYLLLRPLGEGGMGVVYLAQHEALGVTVAVKLLRRELTRNVDLVERFLREARAASALQHPGVVRIFDCGKSDELAFLVMEYLEGDTLRQRLRGRPGGLPERDVLQLGRQLAAILAAAHARGVVHRDLKPDNVMLVADDEVPGGERAKLLDFGVAKLSADLLAQQLRTRTGMVLGTPIYMAPEQASDSRRVDGKADVYALGVMLHELLSGLPPFQGEPLEVLVAHRTTPPPRLRVPGLRKEVAALVLRMLAKRPEARPTMEQVRLALAQHAGGVFLPPEGRAFRRRWLGAALLGAVGLSAGAGGFGAAWLRHGAGSKGAAAVLVQTGSGEAARVVASSEPSLGAAPPRRAMDGGVPAAPSVPPAPRPVVLRHVPCRPSSASVTGGSPQQRRLLAETLRQTLGRALTSGDRLVINRDGAFLQISTPLTVLDLAERKHLELALTEAFRSGAFPPKGMVVLCK